MGKIILFSELSLSIWEDNLSYTPSPASQSTFKAGRLVVGGYDSWGARAYRWGSINPLIFLK
jgi:hypothetical protein